jgi:hypothetical protein
LCQADQSEKAQRKQSVVMGTKSNVHDAANLCTSIVLGCRRLLIS